MDKLNPCCPQCKKSEAVAKIINRKGSFHCWNCEVNFQKKI